MYERLNPTEKVILLEEHKLYERRHDDYLKEATFSPYVSE